MAERVLRLEVPWVALLVAALVPPLAAAMVVMATIAVTGANTSTMMIKMAPCGATFEVIPTTRHAGSRARRLHLICFHGVLALNAKPCLRRCGQLLEDFDARGGRSVLSRTKVPEKHSRGSALLVSDAEDLTGIHPA